MTQSPVFSYLHALGFSHAELFSLETSERGEILTLSNSSVQGIQECIRMYVEKFSMRVDRRNRILKKSSEYSFERHTLFLYESNVRIILHGEEDFPIWLKTAPNPVFLLYMRGNVSFLRETALAFWVVGSRECTPYGESITQSFVPQLSRYGAIVSGWALWIDGLAHEATLRAGGYTIAVMGSGLNHLYPKTHASLFDRILAQGGAILSHFPLDTLPSTYTFPLRNEIIAALSSWIFLVEARNRSGSLITAQIALDIGRDVFAAPADIGRVNSQWCNRLIQSGSAKLVLHPEDILLEYGISPKSNSIPFPPWDQGKTLEMQIAPYIGESPKTPEQIALHFGLSLQETMIHLGKLEIQGTIKASISGKYSLCYA